MVKFFGTDFYGECGFQPDGSYVSTYWVILFYLPVIPLFSARIVHKTAAFSDMSPQYKYLRIPLCWQQIMRVWLFNSALLAGYALCLTLLENAKANNGVRTLVLAGYGIVMLALPAYRQHRAKKRVGFQANVRRLPLISHHTFKWLALLFCAVLLFLFCANLFQAA